jgi:hypothetical protein
MKVPPVVLVVESSEQRSFLKNSLLTFRVLCRTRKCNAHIICMDAKLLNLCITLSADVSNGVAFVFLFSGQASLHSDKIG